MMTDDGDEKETELLPTSISTAPAFEGQGKNSSTKGSSSNRKGRPPPPSQAKRRLEAMASQVDHKLAAAFTIILGLYGLITFGTFMHIEGQDYGTIQSSMRQHSAPLTSTVTRGESGAAVSSVRLEDITDIETLQHTFPINVGDDLEVIDHPAIFMADRAEMKKIMDKSPFLPADGKMTVPKFFAPVAYGPGGIREFLGGHGKRLITPEEAAQIGSFHNGLETIYVSIASYRDPECQPTVSDIFERADHPERIRVAIIDQRAENDEVPPCAQPPRPCSEDPEQMMCKYQHLIDPFEVLAPLSVGPVFARHLGNRMYRGEYFAMQVDSHVRFVEHWDTSIIDQWRSSENEMGVMSVYLSDITNSINPETHANQRPNRPIMCKTDYEGNGKLKHLRHGQQPEGPPMIHGEPTLHPFWAAGFSFARGHFVIQVPYDQYQPMVFQGEEIFIGLRGFTYGYDYYTPEHAVAFHMYAIKENKEKRKKVKLFWENSGLYPGAAMNGMKRLNGIIGMGDPNETYYHYREEDYGLGQARTKEKFFSLYGIHTDTQTVENNLCRFVGKPMQNLFKPFLRKNKMGIDMMAINFAWEDPDKKKKAALPSKPK